MTLQVIPCHLHDDQVEALCSRLYPQKARQGTGEISLFGGVAIGHKTHKGVQRVYAWPFPKKLFRGKCNRQDFVFVRPRGSDPALFHASPDNVWYCRCLLLFTVVVRTDVVGSVRIKCASCLSWRRMVHLIRRPIT